MKQMAKSNSVKQFGSLWRHFWRQIVGQHCLSIISWNVTLLCAICYWYWLSPVRVNPLLLHYFGRQMSGGILVLQCCGAEKPPWQLSCVCWRRSSCLPSVFFPLFAIDVDCRRRGRCAIYLCFRSPPQIHSEQHSGASKPWFEVMTSFRSDAQTKYSNTHI